MTKQTEKKEQQNSEAGNPDFANFIMSLAVTALGHMGLAPEAKEIPVSLPMASQTIDIISMLKEKTAGNLEEHEQRLIDSLLYELRVKYVEQTTKKKNENDTTD